MHSDVEILGPKKMVLEGGTFAEVIRSYGWRGHEYPIKEAQRILTPFIILGHNKKV